MEYMEPKNGHICKVYACRRSGRVIDRPMYCGIVTKIMSIFCNGQYFHPI